MSDELNDGFSGFMPMINNVNVTEPYTMIGTNGELVRAHSVNIVTKTGENYIFSMDPVDLMRLIFLLMKVVQSE